MAAANPWNQFLNAIQNLQAERSLGKPKDFSGKVYEDAEEWLDHFRKCATANNWADGRKLNLVPLYLKDAAARWWQATGPYVM